MGTGMPPITVRERYHVDGSKTAIVLVGRNLYAGRVTSATATPAGRIIEPSRWCAAVPTLVEAECEVDLHLLEHQHDCDALGCPAWQASKTGAPVPAPPMLDLTATATV